jgi:UDP-glucose 4-epimerase
MMRVLVTGGAGYIGSVTAGHLLDLGHAVRVYDDLSTGHFAALDPRAEFFEGRVQDREFLDAALDGVDAVIHFAALSLVGESMREPLKYFRENLSGAWTLLEGMHQAGVPRLVFSSTAAVYGEPGAETIDEKTPTCPVNPYGQSKLMIEELVAEQARAAGLGAICLRYFNACGAAFGLGEHHDPETHLIPRLCRHLMGRLPGFSIFGTDHPTPDGTAVRDYVHVLDLARAHALALDAIEPGRSESINLGTGDGASVREILAVAGSVAGKPVDAEEAPRREGDPPRLVASNARAAERLGWSPEHSALEDILRSAWEWHNAHPDGYPD